MLLASYEAQAARVVYFDLAGFSKAWTTDELCPAGAANCFKAKCFVNVTNVSTASQTVTITFSTAAITSNNVVSAMDGAGTANAANTVTSGTPVPLAAGGRATFAWDFPVLLAGTVVQQDVRCTGKISVEDTTIGTPGFVTATGLLTTWIQGPRPQATGGSGTVVLRAPISYVDTTFPIGEGRPF